VAHEIKEEQTKFDENFLLGTITHFDHYGKETLLILFCYDTKSSWDYGVCSGFGKLASKKLSIARRTPLDHF
jgi:hypothetical protein